MNPILVCKEARLMTENPVFMITAVFLVNILFWEKLYELTHFSCLKPQKASLLHHLVNF